MALIKREKKSTSDDPTFLIIGVYAILRMSKHFLRNSTTNFIAALSSRRRTQIYLFCFRRNTIETSRDYALKCSAGHRHIVVFCAYLKVTWQQQESGGKNEKSRIF